MINRHVIEVNKEWQIKRYHEYTSDIPVILANLIKNSSKGKFGSLLNSEIELLSQSIFYDQVRAESFTHLFYAHQFGLNHFKLATNDSKPVTLTIGETPVPAVGKATRDYIDFGSWMKVFMLSVILRDRNAITFLLKIDNDFMKQGAISFDDLRIAEVELFRCLGNDLKEVDEVVKSYWVAEAKLSKEDPSRNWIDNSSIPMERLIETIAIHDQMKFDEALEKALLIHKSYYSKKSAQSASWGWISFPLLMVCAYAYDRGMKINIESDYLPRWIVEGDFKDCELTVK